MIGLESMATSQLARPNTKAFIAEKSVRAATLPVVVQELADVLGRRLTAFIGGAKSLTEVEIGIANKTITSDAQFRLRTGLELTRILLSREQKDVVQAWFIGLNPLLRDSPVLMLAQRDPATTREPLVRASLAFLTKG
jgi:hypothetical protein